MRRGPGSTTSAGSPSDADDSEAAERTASEAAAELAELSQRLDEMVGLCTRCMLPLRLGQPRESEEATVALPGCWHPVHRGCLDSPPGGPEQQGGGGTADVHCSLCMNVAALPPRLPALHPDLFTPVASNMRVSQFGSMSEASDHELASDEHSVATPATPACAECVHDDGHDVPRTNASTVLTFGGPANFVCSTCGSLALCEGHARTHGGAPATHGHHSVKARVASSGGGGGGGGPRSAPTSPLTAADLDDAAALLCSVHSQPYTNYCIRCAQPACDACFKDPSLCASHEREALVRRVPQLRLAVQTVAQNAATRQRQLLEFIVQCHQRKNEVQRRTQVLVARTATAYTELARQVLLQQDYATQRVRELGLADLDQIDMALEQARYLYMHMQGQQTVAAHVQDPNASDVYAALLANQLTGDLQATATMAPNAPPTSHQLRREVRTAPYQRLAILNSLVQVTDPADGPSCSVVVAPPAVVVSVPLAHRDAASRTTATSQRTGAAGGLAVVGAVARTPALTVVRINTAEGGRCILTAHNAHNERITIGGDRITARLTAVAAGTAAGSGTGAALALRSGTRDAPPPVAVEDGQDGTYTLSFRTDPNAHGGAYALHIDVNDRPAAGSPLAVSVVRRFRYTGTITSCYDNQGILYYLGTARGTQPWRNPHDLGAVVVTMSGHTNPALGPAHVNRLAANAAPGCLTTTTTATAAAATSASAAGASTTARASTTAAAAGGAGRRTSLDTNYVLLTDKKANSWMQVALQGGLRVRPSGYVLSTDGTGVAPGQNLLRNWLLQGSVADERPALAAAGTSPPVASAVWHTLSVHVDDDTLTPSRPSAYWPIDTTATAMAYTHFRVIQTGHNSSKNDHLAATSLELYGELEG
jgi:hypothetical protein